MVVAEQKPNCTDEEAFTWMKRAVVAFRRYVVSQCGYVHTLLLLCLPWGSGHTTRAYVMLCSPALLKRLSLYYLANLKTGLCLGGRGRGIHLLFVKSSLPLEIFIPSFHCPLLKPSRVFEMTSFRSL